MHVKSLRGLFFLLLFASLILGLAASPVRADSLFVNPPNGLPGTTFQIQGSGFSANEGVQLWTRYPDSRIVQLSSANAGGSGSVTFQISTDSSYPFGTYVLLAHGTSSGHDVYGQMTIGSGGSAAAGTAFCQGQNFSVPGFAPGEQVAFTAQLPDGSVQALGTVGADGSGNATMTLPVQAGMPVGSYVITAQGLSSGHQTSDTLTYDGSTLSGSNCSISVAGGSGSYVPALIPSNIVNYQGAGVYLNTNPNALYYFDCSWKWVPMWGIVHFVVLGMSPNESVAYLVQDFAAGTNLTSGSTGADGYGNVSLALNTTSWPAHHIHVWFGGNSSGRQYCGHFDNVPPPH